MHTVVLVAMVLVLMVVALVEVVLVSAPATLVSINNMVTVAGVADVALEADDLGVPSIISGAGDHGFPSSSRRPLLGQQHRYHHQWLVLEILDSLFPRRLVQKSSTMVPRADRVSSS
jgi:hypothetical protein